MGRCPRGLVDTFMAPKTSLGDKTASRPQWNHNNPPKKAGTLQSCDGLRIHAQAASSPLLLRILWECGWLQSLCIHLGRLVLNKLNIRLIDEVGMGFAEIVLCVFASRKAADTP